LKTGFLKTDYSFIPFENLVSVWRENHKVMDNNNNYDEHDGMGFMENDVEVGFVNEEEKHEQVAAYVEVQFANEEAEGEQLAGDNENEQNNLSRSVKELTVLVNKVVDEITVCNYYS
jgi:hypothetical protein